MCNWEMVKKIRNIIVGWWKYFFVRHKEDFASHRLEICKRCMYKEKFMGKDTCSLCGCICEVKVLVEDERCLDGRW